MTDASRASCCYPISTNTAASGVFATIKSMVSRRSAYSRSQLIPMKYKAVQQERSPLIAVSVALLGKVTLKALGIPVSHIEVELVRSTQARVSSTDGDAFNLLMQREILQRC